MYQNKFKCITVMIYIISTIHLLSNILNNNNNVMKKKIDKKKIWYLLGIKKKCFLVY